MSFRTVYPSKHDAYCAYDVLTDEAFFENLSNKEMTAIGEMYVAYYKHESMTKENYKLAKDVIRKWNNC